MFIRRLNIRDQPVNIFGDGLRQAQVNVQSSFIIDARSAYNPTDEVKIIICPPERSTYVQVINHHDGLWMVNYVSHEIGELQILVYLGDKLINNNPFKINVFDINQIHVSNLSDGYVNHFVKFNIDTIKAGIGQLEVFVQDGQVLCSALSRSTSEFDVTFLPRHCGLHRIDIRFNGLTIPGSPFACDIDEMARVTVSNHLTNVHVAHPASFDICNQSQHIDIHIASPLNHCVFYQRTQVNEKKTHIDYILNEIGLHRVDVRSSQNMEVYGSSFLLQSYDTNRLVVSEIPRFIIYNQPVEFTIDAFKAGEGQLEVAINNGQVPNKVKPLGKSTFHFTFIPTSNNLHTLSIKFNGQEIPGFPKECQVITSNDIKIHGPGLNQVLVGSQTWFTIDTSHGGSSNIEVKILSPKDEVLTPSTLLTIAGLRVDWTPTEVGTYKIHITLNGNIVPASPFFAKCYDPKKVSVAPAMNDSIVGKLTKFLIDASKAGEGNLEISVNYSGHNIPNEVKPLGNSSYEVQFIPQKATTHHCHILFNGELVPGSPFPVNVMENQRVMAIGKGLGSVPINIPTSFTVITQNDDVGKLKCSIKGPNDHLVSCITTKIDPNRYEVTYTPDRVGEFHIDVQHDDIPIDSSPFTSQSYDMNRIKTYDIPSSSTVGTPTSFIIDAADSGAGNLEISISRDGKNIPNYVQNEGSARFRVNFVPDKPCIHYVRIKLNGIHIHGSPFACNVFSSDYTFENYEFAPINKRALITIKPKLNGIIDPNIYVDIVTPSGKKLKSKIEKTSTKLYTIGFVPNEIGDHEIRFYHDEEKKLIMTKLNCQVYDISKIRVSDLPLAVTHQPCKFTINTAEVGNGILLVKIKQNGNKVSHEQARISKHVYEISFIPETSDECTIQIAFNGETNLRTLMIPVRTDCEQVRVSPIPSGIVSQPIVFTVDVTDANLLTILVTETHSGRIIPHTMISRLNDKNHYEVSFTPNLARQHTVSITYDNKLVSTYHVDVCNVNKIRVSSINDGYIGIPSIFSVDTHGAGEGHLEVTISDGRRTLPAQLKSIQARKFDIAFIPESKGKHSIVIAFNGIPIEGSPFMMNVLEQATSEKSSTETKDDAEEIAEEEDESGDHEFLIGGQLEGTKVGEVAWLICETTLTEIYEDFSLFVMGMFNFKEEDLFTFIYLDPDQIIIKHTRIQDSGGRWRIEFEPVKSGTYSVQTNVDDLQIILASMDILPLEYERNVYGERIVHPSILNFISVNCKSENMKVQLRNSNGDETPMEIEKESPEWKIYFTLTEIDYYQLSIKNDNNEQLFDIHCVAEETDILRNGGVEDITRIIVDQSKIIAEDVNVIVKDPLAHTIPAAFYRNMNKDLVIEYIPVRTEIHEVFIRTQNNLLDICPIRVMAFRAKSTFDPVLRVQVKEVLEHTFKGVIDNDNKLEINITDPFDKPVPFKHSKNENGELKIILSPVRVGTHWIRITNDESDSFALLPIFAFDDDYVPLSPVNTPSPKDKPLPNQNTTSNNSTSDSVSLIRELAAISETSETSSNGSSAPVQQRSLSPIKEHVTNTAELVPNDATKSPPIADKTTPKVQVLDITDLVDPGVRITSKFSLKDPDNKFKIVLYDTNDEKIPHKMEHLPDGRKCISYEPLVVGPVKIHISKGSEPLNGSPLIVHAFDPTSIQIQNFPKKAFLKTTHSFLIDPTLAGKGSLKIIIKDPNNRSLPITVQKQSNNQILVQFEPIVLGLHSISILFNRISVLETTFQVSNETNEEQSTGKIARLPETEQRGRSIYSKHDLLIFAQQQEKSQTTGTTHPLLAKSSDINILQKEPLVIEEHKQVINKSEDVTTQPKLQYIQLTDAEIRRFQILKEKFERGEPIDIIFDPRRYPFKIILKRAYPAVNDDVHLLIDLPHVVYVHVMKDTTKIPLQTARRNENTFLLKFRPVIEGDYLIILKNHMGQPMLDCPYIFPVYNPDGIQVEPFDPLQPINKCHFICKIDNPIQGKFFIMVFDPLKPLKIPYQIQPLSTNRIQITIIPAKIGTYRIYLAYKNIPT
ncbi:unnamed protein product [Adineta steineri]|uniref:Uncharacterized protein n=2 Tax=Adineta steineri TaxID=433720 RepID=A0A815KWX9_9BILA|nr:unnamed protein product [Adineta steineri]